MQTIEIAVALAADRTALTPLPVVLTHTPAADSHTLVA